MYILSVCVCHMFPYIYHRWHMVDLQPRHCPSRRLHKATLAWSDGSCAEHRKWGRAPSPPSWSVQYHFFNFFLSPWFWDVLRMPPILRKPPDTLRKSNMACCKIHHFVRCFCHWHLHLVLGFSIATFKYRRLPTLGDCYSTIGNHHGPC